MYTKKRIINNYGKNFITKNITLKEFLQSQHSLITKIELDTNSGNTLIRVREYLIK